MIKYPIPLEEMVFIKRLWDELWKKTETINKSFHYTEVHNEKRQLILEVMKLFLDHNGHLEAGTRFAWQFKEDMQKIVEKRFNVPDFSGIPDSKILTDDDAKKAAKRLWQPDKIDG